MENNQVIVKEAPLVDAKEFGLTEVEAQDVEKGFLPVISERENLVIAYTELTKETEITKELTVKAKELRLKLTKVRTSTDKIHKSLKGYYLAGGRFVDAWKNKNNTVVEQMEDKLFEIENHFINLEKQRIINLEAERKALLLPFQSEELMPHGLGSMADTVFDNYFIGVKSAYELRIENERKAEEERIAKEKAEKEEQERIRLENERLKLEAEQREKELAEQKKAQEEERLKAEKLLADEKAKQEAERIKQEKKLADEKKKADEILAKQKEEADKKLKAEQAAKLKLEKELKAKQEAEQKAKEDADKKKKKEQEEAKKLARQPDKQKLELYAGRIDSLEFPEVTSEEAKQIIKDVRILLQKVTTFINEKIQTL